MGKQEAHLPVIGGSLSELRRRERLERRSGSRGIRLYRQELVSEYLAALEVANSSGVIRSKYEVVHPISRVKRLVSGQKDRIIPARTSHRTGKSTMGGWVDYQKTTGSYLLVEALDGYPLSNNDEELGEVIFENGNIGKILTPGNRRSGVYTYGPDTWAFGKTVVEMGVADNAFERRNCQGVWGPSVQDPAQIGAFGIRRAIDALESLNYE